MKGETSIGLVQSIIDGDAGKILLLEGGNFSGRSSMMAECVHHTGLRGHLAVLVSPSIPLSGLMPTVEDELLLHLGPDRSSKYWELVGEWGLTQMLTRNPQTLSGGQRTLLVILCKLALRPRLIAFDNTFEQLDGNNCRRVLDVLRAGWVLDPDSVILISHNGDPVNFRDGVVPIRMAPSSEFARYGDMEAAAFEPVSVSQPSIIEFQSAGFAYGNGPSVLRDLSIQLFPGEIYRLKGPNGSGKTTLSLLLTGYLRLDEGRLLVNGEEFDPYLSPGALACHHFQNPDEQLFEDTVEREFGLLPSVSQESALDFANCRRELNEHPFDLPFVMRKRMALALTLPLPSPWIILDEPTVGQDLGNRRVIAQAMQRLAACGRGLILITHDEVFASEVSHHTIDLTSFS